MDELDIIVELRWEDGTPWHMTRASRIGAASMSSGEVWARWNNRKSVRFVRSDGDSSMTKQVFVATERLGWGAERG